MAPASRLKTLQAVRRIVRSALLLHSAMIMMLVQPISAFLTGASTHPLLRAVEIQFVKAAKHMRAVLSTVHLQAVLTALRMEMKQVLIVVVFVQLLLKAASFALKVMIATLYQMSWNARAPVATRLLESVLELMVTISARPA